MWQEPQGLSHSESQALQQYFMRSVHGFWAACMASFPITSFLYLFARESPRSLSPLVLAPSPPSWASPWELPSTSSCRVRTSFLTLSRGFSIIVEMEDAKVGGAKDSAGRLVSKLLVSSSHGVARGHHGSFTHEVPNNDQIHCETPCYVGVSDLQVPVLGPAMANVVHE